MAAPSFDTKLKHFKKRTDISTLPKIFTKDIYIANMLFAELFDAENLTVLTKE